MTCESTVFLIDDDPDVRASLAELVSSVGYALETYDHAEGFLEAFEPTRPGCLVLDVRMPGMSGLALQGVLRERGHRIPTIFITGYGEVSVAVEAMRGGAIDFLEKPCSHQKLLERIGLAISIDQEQRRGREELDEIRARLERLTRREREVLEVVVEGKTSKEIAAELDVTSKTIDSHRSNIIRKMRADSLPHLVRMVVLADAEDRVTRH